MSAAQLKVRYLLPRLDMVAPLRAGVLGLFRARRLDGLDDLDRLPRVVELVGVVLALPRLLVVDLPLSNLFGRLLVLPRIGPILGMGVIIGNDVMVVVLRSRLEVVVPLLKVNLENVRENTECSLEICRATMDLCLRRLVTCPDRLLSLSRVVV